MSEVIATPPDPLEICLWIFRLSTGHLFIFPASTVGAVRVSAVSDVDDRDGALFIVDAVDDTAASGRLPPEPDRQLGHARQLLADEGIRVG